MSVQPQQHDRSDLDHGQVVDLALLIAGRDPTELLELVDRALHPVAFSIGRLVKARLTPLVRLGRDHRPDATAPQVAPHAGVAVALVTSHRFGSQPGRAPPQRFDRPGLQQAGQHRRLMTLPGGRQDHHRPAAALYPQMQLGGVASTAATQSLPIPVARLVRIGDRPLCSGAGPGRAWRRPWPAGGVHPRRAGGPVPPTRRQSAAASPALHAGRRRRAARPAPGPTLPGGATCRSGRRPSPTGRTRWAGPARAHRCDTATRSLPRSDGGPWVGGPSEGAAVAAVGRAWPTAQSRALRLFVPWARTYPFPNRGLDDSPLFDSLAWLHGRARVMGARGQLV